MRNQLPRTSIVLAAVLVLAATAGTVANAATPVSPVKLSGQQLLGSGTQASVAQTCPLSARLAAGVQAVVGRLLATGSVPLSLNAGQVSTVLACVEAAGSNDGSVTTETALATSAPTPGAEDHPTPY